VGSWNFDVLNAKVVAEGHNYEHHFDRHYHISKLFLISVYLSWRCVESRWLFCYLHRLNKVKHELLKVDDEHQTYHEIAVWQRIVWTGNFALYSFDSVHEQYQHNKGKRLKNNQRQVVFEGIILKWRHRCFLATKRSYVEKVSCYESTSLEQ